MSRGDMPEEEPRVKRVRILGGIVGLIVALVFYIGIPYYFNNYFLPDYQNILAKLGVTVTVVINDDAPLIELFNRWLYAGIPMVILGMLTWAFPKGSRQRFVMSTIYLAASIVWLLYVLNFGQLANLGNVTIDGKTFEFGIVLTFILFLMVLARALKFLILFGVYKDYRRDYLDGE